MEVDPPPSAPGDPAIGPAPATSTPSTDVRQIGHWRVDKQIGRGSFAVVWRARHADTGQRVAVKEIRLDKLNRKLRESLESEIQVLQRSRHGNIIKLHDIIKEEKKIFLVLEYCAGGDVSEFIKKHGRVTEDVARHFMKQMASGLRAMRAQNLIHRDLKPQNLLLTKSSADAELKIADFGFARYMHPTGMAETLCGSPLYMAPEILGYQKYDAKADLWSVGTILYELLVGRPPFTGMNPMQLLRNIERSDAKIPSKVAHALSRECVSILRGLLRRNPVERMSFEEFFDHPFLTGGTVCVPTSGPRVDQPRSESIPGLKSSGTNVQKFGGSSGVDSGMSGDNSSDVSGDSSQMPFPMEDDGVVPAVGVQREDRRGGGGQRYGRDPQPQNPHQTYVHRRRHSPPPQHHAAIPSSVEKAARGVGNVAAAAAIGVRDVAAAAAAVGSNWLSTSPLSRRPGFLGGTSPSGPGRVGSGSHQKPPLSSSPARAAFSGFNVSPSNTTGGDDRGSSGGEIQPVPFSLQGSKGRSGSDRSLNSMDAEYVLVEEEDKGGGERVPMESSSSSAPSGVSGGGLQQMAAGLTRRLSSNIGAAIRGSPPSKPSASPGRELYRVNVNPGGLGLGLQSGVSPSGSFPPRPDGMGINNRMTRYSPPEAFGGLAGHQPAHAGGANGSSGPSSRVSSARSGTSIRISGGSLPSQPPSQSPSEKEAAAALALARMAANAAAAAPGEKQFASLPQRVSVLERAATVLRDVAMERWDSGKRLDALAVSLVSLTALREGYKLAQVVVKEATDAETNSASASLTMTKSSGSDESQLAASQSQSDSGTSLERSESRPASASSSVSGSPPSPGRPGAGTHGVKTHERLRKERERAVKSAERIKTAFNAALQRADRAAAAVKGVGTEGSARLPDAMDLTYDAALALGRSGAVEELMGNARAALEMYSRAQTLLVFILAEGPHFVSANERADVPTDAENETAAALIPPGAQFPARGRIARFVGAIGARQRACAGAGAGASSGSRSMPARPQP